MIEQKPFIVISKYKTASTSILHEITKKFFECHIYEVLLALTKNFTNNSKPKHSLCFFLKNQWINFKQKITKSENPEYFKVLAQVRFCCIILI